MAKWKVVVTDFAYAGDLDIETKILADADAEIVRYQFIDEDDVIKVVKDADAILVERAVLTKRVIDAMDKCQIIAKYAIGTDRIDFDAAKEKNICISNVTGHCIDEVSTHTVGLIISATRKFGQATQEVKNGIWTFNHMGQVMNLRGKTLGLNSFGRIAQLVAEKMQAFGMKVIAFDPFVPAEVAAAKGVELVSFDEMVERADIVSNHAGLTKDTKGVFNRDVFTRMKKTAYFINAGRGPVCNEADLIWALQNGEIAGAGLDVLDPEPPAKDNPMLSMPNVIITPHIAFYSSESFEQLRIRAATNVAQRLNGYYPFYLVNRDIKETLTLKELEQ